jgi:hypothetical protein
MADGRKPLAAKAAVGSDASLLCSASLLRRRLGCISPKRSRSLCPLHPFVQNRRAAGVPIGGEVPGFLVVSRNNGEGLWAQGNPSRRRGNIRRV